MRYPKSSFFLKPAGTLLILKDKRIKESNTNSNFHYSRNDLIYLKWHKSLCSKHFWSVYIFSLTVNAVKQKDSQRKMPNNKFILCFNAIEKKVSEVSAVHLVQHIYRQNFYKLSLRLNFYQEDANRMGDIRRMCLSKITNLMTRLNLWQNHHSFYVIDFDFRWIQRKDNVNNDSASTISNFSYDETSRDSAYSSSSFDSITNPASSTKSNESIQWSDPESFTSNDEN